MLLATGNHCRTLCIRTGYRWYAHFDSPDGSDEGPYPL